MKIRPPSQVETNQTDQIFHQSYVTENRLFSGPTECLMDTLSSSLTLLTFSGALGPAGRVPLKPGNNPTLPHKHYSVYSLESWSFNYESVLVCIRQYHQPARLYCKMLSLSGADFSRCEAKSRLRMWVISKGKDSFSRCQCRNQI